MLNMKCPKAAGNKALPHKDRSGVRFMRQTPFLPQTSDQSRTPLTAQECQLKSSERKIKFFYLTALKCDLSFSVA